MSSLLAYLLFGIMAAYLAAGVPILRIIERWRRGTNRLRLPEACGTWMLANIGAIGFVAVANRLFPFLRVAGINYLGDVLAFGLGLFLTLLILTRLWLRRRLGGREAVTLAVTATLYFLIMGLMVFLVNQGRHRVDRYPGAVTANSSVKVKQQTLEQLTKGLGLNFPDDTRLLWAHSKGGFDSPWIAIAAVELSPGQVPSVTDQLGARGARRLTDCPARLTDDTELNRLFGPWWGPKKWWHPQSAERFEVWTGDPLNVFVDLDDAQTAKLYIIYAII